MEPVVPDLSLSVYETATRFMFCTYENPRNECNLNGANSQIVSPVP